MIVHRESWNFDATRKMVTARYGETQEDLLTPCLNSLRDRQFYAAHHLQNFEQFVAEALATPDSGWSPERLILPPSIEQARSNNLLRARLAAEATACAASLHCLLDTLAHAVVYSLGMNLGTDGLTEQKINLAAVCKRLASHCARDAVADALRRINTSVEVEYLNALVNHSKHRSVIRPGLSFNADSDFTDLSIVFERFTFKGKLYPKREVKAALEIAHGFISRWIVEVGQRLLDQLAKESTPV